MLHDEHEWVYLSVLDSILLNFCYFLGYDAKYGSSMFVYFDNFTGFFHFLQYESRRGRRLYLRHYGNKVSYIQMNISSP